MSYVVSVRTLVDFAARRGDLDMRFHLAPSAHEGMVGHRIVTSRRPAGYQKEITLQAQHGLLTVRGRADGFDPQAGRLEEIKTYRGRLRDMPAGHSALHWAQARLYGHLLCSKLGLGRIELALVYFNVVTQRETLRSETCDAQELQRHFTALCEMFLAWAEQEVLHRDARDAAMLELGLPFESFRTGQRDLAKAVYRGLRDGVHQAIQAPTGIGKTMGTLFPALKGMPATDTGKGLDKIFYLTAKTSGRELALRALGTVQQPQVKPLRIIELASREQACEHPDKQCHGQSCPLAKGFYDRLRSARVAALKTGLLDRAALRRHGLEHAVCPYHLAMELVPWCDVVVGDYNYYFDVGATLHAQTAAQEWRVAVLVDEAHNLVERARTMYSACLRLQDVDTVLRAVAALPDGAALAGLQQALNALRRAWSTLLAGQAEPYQRHDSPPESFIGRLKHAAGMLSERLESMPDTLHDEALGLYFEAQHFLRMAESFGPHSLFESTLPAGGEASASGAECAIRNVIPAPFLKPRLGASQACVLFSATLQPQAFYADMLGLPDSTAWLDVDTPFRAEQLKVHVVSGVSTRYADRAASLEPIARTIAAQYARKPGNYLVFASSFDYLHRLAAAFETGHPGIPVWTQSRGMNQTARADFLARFDTPKRGIGFAVLGGVFAEGIDLPGERLIGAFIATLGLPQINPANEALKQCLEAGFAGCGHDYAYLYPGMRKVVQAAGRILRTPQDEGVVYLMDDRYDRPAVRRLLPAWWRIEKTPSAEPRQACLSGLHARDTA